jgi:hypothetical protein
MWLHRVVSTMSHVLLRPCPGSRNPLWAGPGNPSAEDGTDGQSEFRLHSPSAIPSPWSERVRIVVHALDLITVTR